MRVLLDRSHIGGSVSCYGASLHAACVCGGFGAVPEPATVKATK